MPCLLPSTAQCYASVANKRWFLQYSSDPSPSIVEVSFAKGNATVALIDSGGGAGDALAQGGAVYAMGGDFYRVELPARGVAVWI